MYIRLQVYIMMVNSCIFVHVFVIVLKMLKYVMDMSNRPYNHDALNCMFQLLAHGYDEEAVQVYSTMSGRPKEDTSNALLRCMVIRGRVSRCVLCLLWSAAS